MNDRYRRSTTAAPTISRAIQQTHGDSNPHCLLELSYNDGQPTLKTVEILRELGRFDEAGRALAALSPGTHGYDGLARKLDERDSRVLLDALRGQDFIDTTEAANVLQPSKEDARRVCLHSFSVDC